VTKKQKGIMTWTIIWAGLLIVVLYSPVGSPELYTTPNFYTEIHNVALKSGETHNSPKINSTSGTTSDEMDIPDMNLSTKPTYSVGNYQLSNISTQGTSRGSMQTLSYQNNNSTNGNTNGSGTTILVNWSSVKSLGSSSTIMTNGIATLSTTSDLSNTTSRQSVNADALPGATDPGADPIGDPIPVSDGWGLLIFFGIFYSVFKSKYIYIRFQKPDNK